MDTGAGQTIPDGDYIIANVADTRFYLDIYGGDASAGECTNVQVAENDNPPDVDIWTVSYAGNGGFYKIKQLTGDAYLDVIEPQAGDGQNVQVWPRYEYDDEVWSIAPSDIGFLLQSKANGLYATVDGDLSGGVNVAIRNYSGNSNQKWVFIPYRPSQPVSEGKYILLSTINSRCEVDVSGDSGNISDGTNVQIWEDTAASKYNSFNLQKMSNGYYSLIHDASGKALTVEGGNANVGQNITVRAQNGSTAQQWAIRDTGGGYTLISRCSGHVLDLSSSDTTNGNNIQQWIYNGTNAQKWTFVKAEYAVSYNANGGTGAPGSQTKYYGNTLTLSSTKPTRASTSAGSYKVTLNANGGSVSPTSLDAARTTSYTFNNWKDGNGNTYNAGGSYTANTNATLTAQWNSSTTTATVTLPKPTRDGYTFKGWAESSSATSGVTGNYTPSGNVTLYAIWQRENYYLDINGWLDGQSYSHIEGYGTVDVYINGSLAGQSKTDFYTALPSGTTYEIKNIRPTEGHAYYGINSGSRTGKIDNNTSVFLDFRTCPTSISETPITRIFNGHTYCYYSTPMTWYDAKTLCEALGGHLATITSAEEDQFVSGMLQGDIDAWLGATDIDHEGEWRWITGESFSYTNWMSGQPDNGSSNPEGAENYLQYRDEGRKWNDNPGCWTHSFICEFDTAWYTVSYDANGGTGAPDSQTKTHGTALTLSSGIPTRDGYTFSGWATIADAVTAAYQPGESFTKDADTTLYAIWKETEPDLILPVSLTAIESEAFAGGAFTYVQVPQSVTTIGARAFADCPKLRDIVILGTTTWIDPSAFAGVTDLTIHSPDGSYAEFYASKYGFAFVAQ